MGIENSWERLITVRGKLYEWCIKGNSGDYLIGNPQNIPEDTEFYFTLHYYGHFQENDWWIVISFIEVNPQIIIN